VRKSITEQNRAAAQAIGADRSVDLAGKFFAGTVCLTWISCLLMLVCALAQVLEIPEAGRAIYSKSFAPDSNDIIYRAYRAFMISTSNDHEKNNAVLKYDYITRIS
jgi:hypothetical protein